jgi:hypothetical protein
LNICDLSFVTLLQLSTESSNRIRKEYKMKKITALLLLVSAIVFVSSCKPREKCPAYGKNMPKKVQPAAHS